MRYVDCDTCAGEGRIEAPPGMRFPDEDGLIQCPDCEGIGEFGIPDRLERLVGRQCADRLRAPRRRWARRLVTARALWADRNATTIAAWVAVHRGILQDEPQLRSVIEGELMWRLEAATPLGWRRQDVRWALGNARRALRGLPPLPLPYEVLTSVSMNEQSTDFFERNQLALLAERRRRPKAS